MATYKLIQDIEAEDHILGPLSLRQFIYALVAVFLYYLSFFTYTHGAGFMLVLLLPPGLFCTFFAFPFGKDQSTEVWALAKLRFFLKPRKRIWDQSGMKELVTITAPKKIEIVRTNGLSETEVKSRLSALANTLDSRGWVVKNVPVNGFVQPNAYMAQDSDRLVDVNSMPQEVPNDDVQASDDMLDSTYNPIAQQFDHMITEAEQNHRQQIIARMNSQQPAPPPAPAAPLPATPVAQPRGPSGYWFMTPAAPLPTAVAGGWQNATAPIASMATSDEAALVERLKAQQVSTNEAYAHLRTLRPTGSAQADDQAAADAAQPVTRPTDPAILSLANNNDLNVATLAREAKKAKHEDASDEVVISLR